MANDMITVGADGGAICSYNPNEAEREMYTSLSRTDPVARRRIYDSLNGECVEAKSCLNTVIEVEDVLVHPASKTLPTGEVQEWIRVVLCCSDGRNISCGSRGIWDSIRALCALERQIPWRPAMRLKMFAKGTSAGNHIYLLSPVDEVPAGKKKS